VTDNSKKKHSASWFHCAEDQYQYLQFKVWRCAPRPSDAMNIAVFLTKQWPNDISQ